ESANHNAVMGTRMTERFSAPGATLVKLFGRPDHEVAEFGARARRVADIGVRSAMAQMVFLTALVSFERVFEVLDLEPLITEKPDAVRVPEGPVSIEFGNVHFAYPSADRVSLASLEEVATLDTRSGVEVLHGVSFKVEPGQLVALVGSSGAGKSTIASLVPRLYDVDDGEVLLAGIDVRDLSFDSLRETLGMVTQDGHLFHDTIRENLRFAAPGATEEELWESLHKARLATLVESLPDGLDTVVGERGYRLSGGERQRLTIARLLLAKPRVVILDEATAHLDSTSEAAVQAALVEALAGRTALVIAHRLSTIRAADAIVVIEEGRVVEHGTHTELLALGGRYAELYRTQFEDDTTTEAVA
ncbi:MAG TPA: ABC transporter ATP-binding protein, partial [Acidimicrobiia bacterium]|nr:ABC transporter ATP-binding protein [Acidimicrobiia bacterium]